VAQLVEALRFKPKGRGFDSRIWSKASGFSVALRRWAYNLSGFNKYGLRHDDCYDENTLDVKEALRRLPAYLVDERNFRIMRAMQLSIQKIILPKEEWVKFTGVPKGGGVQTPPEIPKF
jgi:ubiquinol-cytochrome c reductase subunit 7